MSLFKKREEIPTIPPAPSLPRMDSGFSRKESSGLPNLPESTSDIVNRADIKSAVEDSSERKGGLDVGTIRSPPSNFQESNSLPTIEPVRQEPVALKIEEPPRIVESSRENIIKPIQLNEDSIFVKFDKYHSAKEDMTEIKSYLKSIEILVGELNNSKKEENDELEELEEEINKIKEKFNEVDSKVFNKL